MKKITKRALAGLLVALMVVLMMPVMVFATVSDNDVCKIGETGYATLQAAIDASKSGDTIEIIADVIEDASINKEKADITISGKKNSKGEPFQKINKLEIFGRNVKIENLIITIPDKKLNAENFSFDNCVFTGTNGIRTGYANGNCFINNCKFNTTVYGIHFDGGKGNVFVTNCDIIGFNTFASNVKMYFDNCTFTKTDNNQYCVCQTWGYMGITNSLIDTKWKDTTDPNSYIGTANTYCLAELTNVVVKDNTKTIFDYVGAEPESLTTIDATKVDSKLIGGFVVIKNDEASINYLNTKTHSECESFKLSDTLYIVGKGAKGTNGKLTAGLFTLNPIAYVAEGYSVEASEDQTYPYKVCKPTTPQKEIVVEHKAITEVGEKVDEQDVAEEVLEKVDVKGVANALTEKGKDEIVKEAVTDKSDLTPEAVNNAKLVDISISVKAEATQVITKVEQTKQADKIIAFELTPYAIVTATSSEGVQVSSEIHKVDNDYLAKNAKKAITVKLGCNFEPKQVVHIREDGIIETFSKGSESSYEDKTFTYENEVVTLEITQFSEIQLLADKKYVDVKFDANGGTGVMENRGVAIGEKLELPENGFTAPTEKVFKAWSVGGKEVAPGEKITVNEATVVKAVWKDASPKTGDNNNIGLFVGLGGFALLGIIALAVIMLKKKTYR